MITATIGKKELIAMGRLASMYFTQDSIERQIFKPESEMHATREQLRDLLDDAKFYSDANGPDECPDGLIPSAKRVVVRVQKLLSE
jgi:hypothetical protein